MSNNGHLNTNQPNDLKSKSKCRKYGEYGHWNRELQHGGSIRQERGSSIVEQANGYTIQFWLAYLAQFKPSPVTAHKPESTADVVNTEQTDTVSNEHVMEMNKIDSDGDQKMTSID